MTAAMGTRYQLSAFEILDNEELKEITTEPQKTADNEAKEDDCKSHEKRKWSELRPSQQAGIRCNEAIFNRFLADRYGSSFRAYGDSAAIVRDICCVASRSVLNIDDEAELRWVELELEYRAWQDAPKHGVG